MMSWKNRNKKAGLCVMVVAGGFILAGLCVILAMPETALAKKPDKPPGQDELNYTVNLVSHTTTFEAPTYLPEISAETRAGIYSAWFERHDLAATVYTTLDFTTIEATLTDDISLHIGTDSNGKIISFQLMGQDVIGKVGIIHKSEVVAIDPPVVPSTDGFILHVDTDNIEIWKYNKHRNVGGAKRVAMVGYISVGDLVYTPLP